jgi:hypothetical protein
LLSAAVERFDGLANVPIMVLVGGERRCYRLAASGLPDRDFKRG